MNEEITLLYIHNAFKQFGLTKVLDNIDLVIEPSTIVGLAGSSGSGKSTLLRCIQKLEQLDSGSIHLKEKSGFMFQDFQLFPHMTVLNNLTYAPMFEKKNNDIKEKAINLLETLGVDDKAQYLPHQLSGGQKQRVALARSLMMEPKLLLCDEPTSGLDVATIQDVINLLSSIRDMGVTMLIASHDLDFLSQLADRIVVLKEGKLAADINPRIINKPVQYLKKYY